MQDDLEGQTPLRDDEQSAASLPLEEAATLERHAPARRKRLARAGLALVVVLVVLVVFRGVLPTSPAPAPAPALRPTFPPPLALFASNVNFGAMLINGRAFAKQPVLLPVLQERYTVTLAAPPFRPVTCQITTLRSLQLDAGPDQHCEVLMGSFGVFTLNGMTGAPTYVIGVALGLADLPADQQAAVQAVIAAQVFTLRQQTTVPAGDYYAAAVDQSGSITSQRAARPLRAEVSLVSPAGVGSAPPLLCGGSLVCAGPIDPGIFPSSLARDWLIGIASAVRWRFTTQTGQVAGEATYLFTGVTLRFLTYDAARGWQVDEAASQMVHGPDELGDDACQAGGDVLQMLARAQGVGYSYNNSSSIAGCILTVDEGAAGQVLLLWRFGVLLAVNPPAHASFPALPLAPPDELAAVAQG